MTTSRKIALVFAVSILLWLLALKALGQDLTGFNPTGIIGSKTLGSIACSITMFGGPTCGVVERTPIFTYHSVVENDSIPVMEFKNAGHYIFPRKPLISSLIESVKSYRPYGDRRILNWSLCIFSGISWGIHEAVYADASILEKRFGFSKYSWGGSEAWQSKYPGGRHYDGAKPVLWKDKTNIFREAKKTTAYLGRYPFYTVGISITMNRKRHWLDYIMASGLYTLSSLATYNILRE